MFAFVLSVPFDFVVELCKNVCSTCQTALKLICLMWIIDSQKSFIFKISV